MINQFYVIGSQTQRPAAERIIYCDGSADQSFRPEQDIELSHWVPNRTPPAYKADTSTEICMNFVEQPLDGDWSLAINNHVDVDGILSVYTVLHSEQALKQRDSIVQAAEMGDFWGWGERPAQILFQGLTRIMDQLEEQETDPYELYQCCFERVPMLLTEIDPKMERICAELQCLENSVERIESGEIERTVIGNHFVHYAIPQHLADENYQLSLHVPEFNEAISDACLLWPQARARSDDERVTLVSVAVADGWHYDLWYPGYTWAETPNRWRAPGLTNTGSMKSYHYSHKPLASAVEELRRTETGKGRWQLTDHLGSFSTLIGRGYPVVLSFVDEQSRPAISKLKPETLVPTIASAFP